MFHGRNGRASFCVAFIVELMTVGVQYSIGRDAASAARVQENLPVMELTVEQIAQLVGGVIYGNPAQKITGVNSLTDATPGDLGFARSPRYYDQLRASAASAVLAAQTVPDAPMTIITVAQPDVAFLQALQQFTPEPAHPAVGVHPQAWVADDALVGDNVAIGPFVSVESGAILGDNVVVYPHVHIGRHCRVGANTILYPNVVIREYCEIGVRCILHAGACIGSDGFGFAPLGGQWLKIPQTGTVCIGDDVEIGSNSCVDRATFGVTRIGSGTKIDNLVQIGHNVNLGEHCAIAGMTGIAGSVRIGNHVRVGANAGIAGHIEIDDGATIGARAGVMRPVEKERTVSGFPAIDHDMQRRVLVAQQRTPEMLRRLHKLEQRLKELEGAI